MNGLKLLQEPTQGDAVAKHIMNRDQRCPNASEWDWIGSEIDFTINNDGTLEELYASIDKIIDKLPKAKYPMIVDWN